MITQEDVNCLRRIRDGACASHGVPPANHAMIVTPAAQFGHRPEVVAGILMRESRGGEILDDEGLGDRKHGHGLMQIDDRSFPGFCNATGWRDPARNVEFGCIVLSMKRTFLSKNAALPAPELERAAIAAYNCGEGRVLQSIQQGEDVDTHTTGRDYSRAVLAYADAYASLERPPAEQPPAPSVPPALPDAPAGLLASILDWLMRLLVKKPRP